VTVALNQDFIGKVYPAGPAYEVGREKIREFATAIGDMNPAYHDEAAARAYGHRDLIAPPTFPFVISMRAMAVVMFDPELGLDYSRVVHGEQRFAYSRPITAGDRLVVETTIENIRVAAGNDILTSRSELSTEDGEHVVTTWAVTVARGTAEETA
jgi:acyl dehydratase